MPQAPLMEPRQEWKQSDPPKQLASKSSRLIDGDTAKKMMPEVVS
jgi:hypothetical protein